MRAAQCLVETHRGIAARTPPEEHGRICLVVRHDDAHFGLAELVVRKKVGLRCRCYHTVLDDSQVIDAVFIRQDEWEVAHAVCESTARDGSANANWW